jgi:hypothetical protein
MSLFSQPDSLSTARVLIVLRMFSVMAPPPSYEESCNGQLLIPEADFVAFVYDATTFTRRQYQSLELDLVN